MARLIPPEYDPSSSPPGEKILFNKLKKSQTTNQWIVLHSLDIARHYHQLQGEADFVILVPTYGLLTIEVKSHLAISRSEDGYWRLGEDPPTTHSPFRQASANMHSIRQEIRNSNNDYSNVLQWSAVCFPRAVFKPPESIEWHSWQIIDKEDLENSDIKELIEGILIKAQQHIRASSTGSWFKTQTSLPSVKDCEEIAQLLRPHYEFFESPTQRRKANFDSLKRYTDEQYQALDLMQSNDRVIFEGAAGTGKTLLAIESVRRQSLKGESVLFLCFNKLLGQWLKRETQTLEGVETSTFHAFLAKITGQQSVENPHHDYWSIELPNEAIRRLTHSDLRTIPYTVLVIDEAQDLITTRYLSVLDLLVKNGLQAGKCLFFGDFKHQSIFTNRISGPIQNIDHRLTGYTSLPLWNNCRNTPRIASLIELVSQQSVYRNILRPDDGIEPQWHNYSNSHEQVVKLEQILHKLTRDGFRNDEIVILSPLVDSCAIHIQEPTLKRRIRTIESAGVNHIQLSTIHAFKGLEARAVVITDIADLESLGALELLYVGASRATERLEILRQQSTIHQLLNNLNIDSEEGKRD